MCASTIVFSSNASRDSWAVLGFLWRLMGLGWDDAGDAGHSACFKTRHHCSDCKISSDHTLLTWTQNVWCYRWRTYLGIPILIKVIYARDTSPITVGVVHMAHITSAFPRITRHHRLWTKQTKHSLTLLFNAFIFMCQLHIPHLLLFGWIQKYFPLK